LWKKHLWQVLKFISERIEEGRSKEKTREREVGKDGSHLQQYEEQKLSEEKQQAGFVSLLVCHFQMMLINKV
jgi:hypothetical protein